MATAWTQIANPAVSTWTQIEDTGGATWLRNRNHPAPALTIANMNHDFAHFFTIAQMVVANVSQISDFVAGGGTTWTQIANP